VLWNILLPEEFAAEMSSWPDRLRDKFDRVAKHLQEQGPSLGRPQVDHLKGSRHANMKEMRFSSEDGCWRVAFAFNPARQAVILASGDKSGVSQNRFYNDLLKRADARYETHLEDERNKRKPRCLVLMI
jgi:hypothetical protein